MRCPHCASDLEFVYAAYSERIYGMCRVDGYNDLSDFDTNDSDSFEIETYECPECAHTALSLDDFKVPGDGEYRDTIQNTGKEEE